MPKKLIPLRHVSFVEMPGRASCKLKAYMFSNESSFEVGLGKDGEKNTKVTNLPHCQLS